MSNTLKIGTRDSELATWQAKQVAGELQKLGHNTELIFIKSEGDLDLKTPLTQMGGKGVFTKALDDALLGEQIDLAVHSFKDLPTRNPLPLKVAAVMEREDPRDALVAPGGIDFLEDPDYEATIATSSNRRSSQWRSRFPRHTITNIRGNVNTRLHKVRENEWDGAIFAAAGLKRIGLDKNISSYLEWMVPAPAQGAMAVMIREEDEAMEEILRPLNHADTVLCTGIERDFLHDMEAGCSAPVGAFAEIRNGHLYFIAIALSLDGKRRFEIELDAQPGEAAELGHRAADELLAEGAAEVIVESKKS